MVSGERDLLLKFMNPFIVQMLWTYETEEKHYFVMEYLSGGRLFFHLK